MDPRVEEILMARAMRDSQSVPDAGTATVGGAIPGALVGAAAGSLPHMILKNTTGRLPGRSGAMKPGARMAGGLVGAILGGSLGAGTRQMMIDNSPAASILAKAQTGEMTPSDQALLAEILTDTYKTMGLS